MKTTIISVLEEVTRLNAALAEPAALDHVHILALARKVKLHATEVVVGIGKGADRDFLLTAKKEATLIAKDAEAFLKLSRY